MTRASLEKKPHEVAAMFDRVAKRYDVTNTVMAFAQDRRWRRATRIALDLRPTDRCLDLAAGTAVSSVELAKSGADVIACDFSLGMLQEGQGRGVPLIAGDAMHLPFARCLVRRGDDLFRAAQRRRHRGGAARDGPGDEAGWAPRHLRVQPARRGRPFRTVYTEYLMKALPEVARRVSSNPEAYVYLAESIRAVARSGRAVQHDCRGGLAEGRLAQPDRRRSWPCTAPIR